VLIEEQKVGATPGGHQQRQRLALAAGERADRVVHARLELHVERRHAVAQLVLQARRQQGSQSAA